jgi:hypothetical protein
MSDIDEEYMRELKELHRWETDANAGMERMAELRCDPTVDPDLISEILRREHEERMRRDAGENKIHSADIEPNSGYHYLIINGQQAARFDCIQKALTAREVTLQPNEMEGPER